jgi:hypothetical protein
MSRAPNNPYSSQPYLRLGGCRQGSDGVDALMTAREAEWFTLYVMDGEGLAHAVADLGPDLMEALGVTMEAAFRTGLEASLCPWLQSEVIRFVEPARA